MSDETRSVARHAETLLFELSQLITTGPYTVRLVHRFHEIGTECRAGEEVWAAYLAFRGRENLLRLPLALRLALDYLARTRHVPQSAAQIAAGLRRLPFYRKHGSNSGIISRRKFSRSSIKEYVKRLRTAFAIAGRECSIALDGHKILASRVTVGNQVLYQLCSRVEWLHID
jgi:hypothetical protein